MKMIKYFIPVLSAAVLILSSCDREPITPPEPVIDYVKISELRAFHNGNPDTTFVIDTNIYIQGIVTLTPELGNLPGQIAYMQDSTAGICLKITGTNTFAMNSEVRINCKGLSLTYYNGLLQFGDIDLTLPYQVKVIDIAAGSPEPVSVTIRELLEGKHQSEYISVTGVQFKATGTFSGTKVLTDCSSEIDVYTRSAATFAANTVPGGNGTLKGIASIYTTTQILLRDPAELEMTGDLCGVPSFIYLSQNFNTLTTNYTNVSALAGWQTYSEAGTKTWFSYKTSSLGPFVETTAYGSNQASVITWMITPQLDLSVAVKPYIQFESADGYDNGATLELFVSTDYTGSATPWTSTWTKLEFNRPPVTTSGYSAFVSSGLVDLSAYNGSTIYLALVYKGSDLTGTASDKTTTWEVDNVVIAED
jgi:hypothetical protein